MSSPTAVANLDLAIVTEVLARRACNITDAAADLGVPPSDLRRLLWANPKLQDEAFEVVEGRLDLAEKNIMEALASEDSRRRDAASFFTLRNTSRARRRGWITSSAASVGVNVAADSAPGRIVVRWQNPGESDDEEPGEDEWKPPVYDDGRRDGDIEGELAGPSAMLEHAAAGPERAEEPAVVEPAAAEPESAVIEAPEPESAAARYARERIEVWIRARLIAYPVDRCCHCRLPFVAGQQWREAANDMVRARFHAACQAEWRAEREAAARQALGLEG